MRKATFTAVSSMLKTPSLMNMDFGVFPKASDHEVSSEVGWLLYSTKSQDKERPSELISALVKENTGVKWRPIRVNDHFKKGSHGLTPTESMRCTSQQRQRRLQE